MSSLSRDFHLFTRFASRLQFRYWHLHQHDQGRCTYIAWREFVFFLLLLWPLLLVLSILLTRHPQQRADTYIEEKELPTTEFKCAEWETLHSNSAQYECSRRVKRVFLFRKAGYFREKLVKYGKLIFSNSISVYCQVSHNFVKFHFAGGKFGSDLIWNVLLKIISSCRWISLSFEKYTK